jgi:hypothetical protein
MPQQSPALPGLAQIAQLLRPISNPDRATAKPESMYPEAAALTSTRPPGRGPQRQVFVAGVEGAATLHETKQDTVTLVSL